MHTAPSTAEPADRPERDGAGVPERIGAVLRLLQVIVGFGKIFAETLHERGVANFHAFASRYRRSDFNEILARIKRGLMLAAALEARLLRRAKSGRDIVPVTARWDTSRRERAGSAPKRTRVRHVNIVDMAPDPLPSAEQIAAELRRRPLGAVLVDICRDLGVRPHDLTREQWKELRELILEYGGAPLSVLFAEWNIRLRFAFQGGAGKQMEPADTGAPSDQTACSTGPPPLAAAA